MKHLAISILFLLPHIALAQDMPGMNQADMQKMMQQAQKMQACMGKIDQAKLKELEQVSKKFDAEMRALCKSGKRAEAEQKAMSFGKKMQHDPTVEDIRKCGEMMQGMMQEMPFMNVVEDDPNMHVCDQEQ